jgi:hypothetical protein
MDSSASASASYPSFDPQRVDLCNYDADGATLVATLPNSMLPLSLEAAQASFRVRYCPDKQLDLDVARRMTQGRQAVFQTCCRVLNPLEGLTLEYKDAPRCTFRLAELLLRSAEAHRLSQQRGVPNVLLIGAHENLRRAFEPMRAAVSPLPLDVCMDTRLRSAFFRQGKEASADLCFCEGVAAPAAAAPLAQLVVALHCLRPGGTLMLKMALDGPTAEGLLFTVMRHYFAGAVFLCKPQASRPTGEEVYLVACGRRTDHEVAAQFKDAPKISDLIVWLERSAMTMVDSGSGSVQYMQRDETRPPFAVAHNFSVALSYWVSRYSLLRQKTTRAALDLCRIVIEHRPIVSKQQLQHLREACAGDAVLRDIARTYAQRWSPSRLVE